MIKAADVFRQPLFFIQPFCRGFYVVKQWRLGSGWMVVAAFFFALMGVFVKLGSAHFSFLELVFWRTAISAIILIVIGGSTGGSLKTKNFKAHFLRALYGYGGLLLFFYTMIKLPLATAVTLNYTSPMFLALLSFILLKERISTNVALGLSLGFIGVFLLLQPGLQSDEWFAGILGLCSGFLAGLAYLQVRELAQLGEPEWKIVLYFALISTAIGAVLVSFGEWHPIDFSNIWYLLGLGGTATIAQLAMTRAYKVGRKFFVASLSYLTVVCSCVFGVLLLGDVLHGQDVVAIAIIITSGLLTSLRKNK